MASEALQGEADKSSASPGPSEDKAAAGNEAVASSVDETTSGVQQAHVSDASAEAKRQQQSNDNDNGDIAASEASSTQKANTTLCGVCESNPGKYKCSRCRLP
jgi:hypothetical protein